MSAIHTAMEVLARRWGSALPRTVLSQMGYWRVYDLQLQGCKQENKVGEEAAKASTMLCILGSKIKKSRSETNGYLRLFQIYTVFRRDIILW